MRGREYEANQVNKRGVVVDRAPERQQIRVQFEDEDGVISYWIDVTSRSGSSTQTYMMPDLGDEVWCAMDAKGEDGCLIGVKYNDTAPPPYGSNDDIGLIWPGGSVHIHKGSGAITVVTNGPVNVTTSASVNITAGSTVKIEAASIELVSETLTHNGTDISDDHVHTGIRSGPSLTGPPA